MQREGTGAEDKDIIFFYQIKKSMSFSLAFWWQEKYITSCNIEKIVQIRRNPVTTDVLCYNDVGIFVFQKNFEYTKKTDCASAF